MWGSLKEKIKSQSGKFASFKVKKLGLKKRQVCQFMSLKVANNGVEMWQIYDLKKWKNYEFESRKFANLQV